MSALRERKKFKCKEHEYELLKYVCEDCRYKLVCNIGKNTRHRGHHLLDIKTAGDDTRNMFKEEIKVTKECIRDTRRAWSKKTSFKINADKSMEETLCDLQTNVNELKRKMDGYLDTQKKYTEQFAKEHSDQELPKDIETLSGTLQSLRRCKSQMTKFSGKRVPDVKLIEQFCMLETSEKLRVEARTKTLEMSGRNTLVFLLVPSHETPLKSSNQPTSRLPNDWENIAKKMIGFPKMAQTADQDLTSGVEESKESYSSDMAMVHMLSLQLGDFIPILALHIADEDRIFVAHGEKSSIPLPATPGGKIPTTSGDISISFLNNNGTKLLPDKVFEAVVQPAITTTLPDKRVKLFCTQNGASVKQDIFDLGTLFPRDQVHQEFFCAVKKKPSFPGKLQSYQIYKIRSRKEEEDELLFTVHLEDTPLRVVANRNLEAFAIILQQNSGSKKKKKKKKTTSTAECPPEPQLYVSVYTKKDKDSTITPYLMGVFGEEELKNAMALGKGAGDFHISDVCFYQKSNTTSPSQNGDEASKSGSRSHENGEMLIIATVTALIVVDYENACAVLDFFFLGYSLPDRRDLFPTALTTDKDGQLWIGCRGGKVLCWKHIEDVLQSTYMEPVTVGDGSDSEGDWPEDEFENVDEDGETTSTSGVTSDDRGESGIESGGSVQALQTVGGNVQEGDESAKLPQPVQPIYGNFEEGDQSPSSGSYLESLTLRQVQARERRNSTQSQAAALGEPNQFPQTPPPLPPPRRSDTPLCPAALSMDDNTSPPPRPPRRLISQSSGPLSPKPNSDPASAVQMRQHPEQQTGQTAETTLHPTRESSNASAVPSPTFTSPHQQPMLMFQDELKKKAQERQTRQLTETMPQSTQEPRPPSNTEKQPSPQHHEEQQEPIQQRRQQPQQPVQQPQQHQQLQHLFEQQQQQLSLLQQQLQQKQTQQQPQPFHQQQPSLSPQTAPRPAALPPSSPATGPAVVPSSSRQPPPKIAPKPANARKAASSAEDSISRNPTSPGPISSISKGTATSPNRSSVARRSPRSPNQGGGQDSDNNPANMSVLQKAKYFRGQMNKP